MLFQRPTIFLVALFAMAPCAAHAQIPPGIPPAPQNSASIAQHPDERAAHARLYQLGYPAESPVAVKRWRADTGRRAEGPLTADEINAVMAQPDPEFFAAFAGNPFAGMGLGLRHKSRAEAEAQAAAFCRQEGGAKECRQVYVIPGGQCMFVSGYLLKRGDRRPSRGSFAIAPSMEVARAKSFENCRAGAIAPTMCRPMLSFCADGSQFERFNSAS